jgi:hypothetical protein
MHYLSATKSVRDARKVEQLTSSEARIMAFEEAEQHSFPFSSARGRSVAGPCDELTCDGLFRRRIIAAIFLRRCSLATTTSACCTRSRDLYKGARVRAF